jgi:hypothetical protein
MMQTAVHLETATALHLVDKFKARVLDYYVSLNNPDENEVAAMWKHYDAEMFAILTQNTMMITARHLRRDCAVFRLN